MTQRPYVLLYALALLFCFPGCEPPERDDDDSSAGDDDDSSAGDDDDSTAATSDCAALEAALQDLASWPVQTSCGHFFSASTAGNDYRLAVSFVVTETAPTVGMSFVLSLDGSTVANQVSGALQTQAGYNLNTWDCNDALDPSMKPIVTEQWNPIAGTATLQVTAVDGEAWPGGPILFTGDVILENVDVEPDTQQGTTCQVPDTTWSGQSFGWLAG